MYVKLAFVEIVSKPMKILNSYGNVIFNGQGEFIGANLVDLCLSNAVLNGLVLQGAHFDGSDLKNATFRDSDLYWASFFGADLSYADFSNAILSGADLSCACLIGARLVNSNLGPDNVGGWTNLAGANLRGADLTGAKLELARYSSGTLFPEGFLPENHGMVFSPEH